MKWILFLVALLIPSAVEAQTYALKVRIQGCRGYS